MRRKLTAFAPARFAWVAIALVAFTAGCTHAPKKIPELSKMEGRKVALVEVEGEATPRSVVEVALVNQLIKRGSFILISKQEVEAARSAPAQDPTDWLGLARRVSADYALRAKVLKFDADEKEGYSSESVEDSQLAAERGEKDSKMERMFKVKSLTGTVQVQLEFTRLEDGDRRTAVADAEETVKAEAKESAAHLPPRLRFLETLSNEAFRLFFEKYN